MEILYVIVVYGSSFLRCMAPFNTILITCGVYPISFRLFHLLLSSILHFGALFSYRMEHFIFFHRYTQNSRIRNGNIINNFMTLFIAFSSQFKNEIVNFGSSPQCTNTNQTHAQIAPSIATIRIFFYFKSEAILR